MTTRRRFLQFAAALAAGAAARPVSAFCFIQSSPLQRKTIGEGLTVVIGEGGNSLVAITSAGPILIDTKNAHAAKLLESEVKAIASGAPGLLIDTHHHADHIGGNWAFSSAPSRLAHANLKPRIAATIDQRIKSGMSEKARELGRQGREDESKELLRVADSLNESLFAPNQEFTSTHSLDHGGIALNLHHFGAGHTDNDAVVHLSHQNVVHTGDLVFNQLYPFIDRSAKANTAGWQNSLRKTLELCDDKTVVIPGHGDVGDKTILQAQIDFFDRAREAVATAIKEGKNRDQVAALKPDAFTGFGLENIRPMCLGAIFDELNEEPKTAPSH